MHKRHGLSVALLYFSMVLPCAAQREGPPPITGKVSDAASHEPLAGVSVQLVVGGGKLAAPAETTSTEGQFQFSAHDGDYTILANKDGYLPAQVKVSIFASHQTNVTIDLQRQSPEGSTGTGPGGAVSAHQLSVPNKAHEAYEKGMALMNGKKDYAGALAQFESAIREYPSYYEAYAGMGIMDYYLGDAPAAEDALRKSIDLSSGKYPDAIFDLAEVFNNIGRFADAEPAAREAIALEGSSWRGYFELARAQFGLKRPADAAENAAKARDLKPDYPLVYLVLSNIHLALHNYGSVLQDMDAYLKLVPNSPTSDQVRKTRQQVERALEKAQAQSAAVPRS
jgi:Tfp pilus assembly protein PilF